MAGGDMLWQPQPEVGQKRMGGLQVAWSKLYPRPCRLNSVQGQGVVLSSLTWTPNAFLQPNTLLFLSSPVVALG